MLLALLLLEHQKPCFQEMLLLFENRYNKNMINLQINSRASTKGHSGVFAGGWLPVFWTSYASSSVSSVQLLPWRPRGSGQQDLKLTFFQRGRCPSNGGFLTLPVLSTGGRDREVGQACLHSHRIIAIEKVVILSADWASGRQANNPPRLPPWQGPH